MSFKFVDFEEAQKQSGLRMVVVTRLPSPWGEAAKGILKIKKIDWTAVPLDQGNDEMAAWTGQRRGPVAMYNDEQPRGGWAEILLLAERLSPEPALIPASASDRSLMFGLAHEVCGEMGLGWMRRLSCIHAGLTGGIGFPEGVAHYLAPRYGYRAEEAEGFTQRIVEILRLLSDRLHAQAQNPSDSPFYVGGQVSAMDVYSATFMALFKPLPPEYCPMPDALRLAFETLDDSTAKALDPILIEHRDRMYQDYLELPLTL